MLLRDHVHGVSEADERHTEVLQRVEPLVELPGPELDPGVVLDPVLDRVRRVARARERARDDDKKRCDE